MPVSLATQEAEIGGFRFQANPVKKFLRPYLEKKTITKKGAGGMAQGVGP
jgi:hypothetical protein